MNTDRESLEKAAKAAGYDHYVWIENFFDPECGVDSGLSVDYGIPWVWNPLESNDDAFMLMCDLRLEVAVHETYSGVINGNLIGGHVKHGDDIYAATRRAITLAAARIWEEANASNKATN